MHVEVRWPPIIVYHLGKYGRKKWSWVAKRIRLYVPCQSLVFQMMMLHDECTQAHARLPTGKTRSGKFGMIAEDAGGPERIVFSQRNLY